MLYLRTNGSDYTVDTLESKRLSLWGAINHLLSSARAFCGKVAFLVKPCWFLFLVILAFLIQSTETYPQKFLFNSITSYKVTIISAKKAECIPVYMLKIQHSFSFHAALKIQPFQHLNLNKRKGYKKRVFP